jgi:hypothetical protein
MRLLIASATNGIRNLGCQACANVGLIFTDCNGSPLPNANNDVGEWLPTVTRKPIIMTTNPMVVRKMTTTPMWEKKNPPMAGVDAKNIDDNNIENNEDDKNMEDIHMEVPQAKDTKVEANNQDIQHIEVPQAAIPHKNKKIDFIADTNDDGDNNPLENANNAQQQGNDGNNNPLETTEVGDGDYNGLDNNRLM